MNTIDVVIPIYNDDSYLTDTLHSVYCQILPEDWSLSVYIVDDGSRKPISVAKPYSNTTLLRHISNKGRSAACNTGANSGKGKYIYILDADCVLRNQDVLSCHIATLYKCDTSMSCGSIYKNGGDFWSIYQNAVANRREREFENGDFSSLTTANCLITRRAFEAINGFDEGFTQCGFEDRDLLLRLIKAGYIISYCQTAPVEHMCDLSLDSVAKKLYKGGAFSSKLFMKKHALDYEKMHFSKADVKYSRIGLQSLVFLTKPILWPSIKLVDWTINKGAIPYSLSSALVKYLSGLAYLHGTQER